MPSSHMDGLHIFLVVLFGVVSCSHDSISGSVLEPTVRPGDNITLYCDCKSSSGVSIVWYRNCSHENQPSLVLKVKRRSSVVNDGNNLLKILPRFQFMRNSSSESYDLLIMNITESDEGLYYCGTEQPRVEDKEFIFSGNDYRYGNVTTRILFDSSWCPDSSGCISNPELVVSSLMVFSLLSSFISFILFFYFCQKTDKEPQILSDTRGQTRWDQDEDACFTRVVFWAKDRQTHH
ncbi:uncharacterized protein LOC141765349 isoform X2 [Sebastes fasciatus]|uniref:uncharacterized protein LOC141765349 isoform X2 n=1 Tax=Sebastes fasciatus TaxID=394691 RepID=UPI003D9F368C